MKINVTKTDIRLGSQTPSSCDKCPVARALRRAGMKRAIVGTHDVSLEERPEFEEVELPEVAKDFISDMCRNRPIKPFSFTLTAKEVKRLRSGK